MQAYMVYKGKANRDYCRTYVGFRGSGVEGLGSSEFGGSGVERFRASWLGAGLLARKCRVK